MAPSSLGTFLTNLDRNQSLALFLMASDTGRRNMGGGTGGKPEEPEDKPEEPEENRRKTGGKPEENRRRTGGEPEENRRNRRRTGGCHRQPFQDQRVSEAPVLANSRNRTVLELKLNRFETKQAERLHFRAKCSL